MLGTNDGCAQKEGALLKHVLGGFSPSARFPPLISHKHNKLLSKELSRGRRDRSQSRNSYLFQPEGRGKEWAGATAACWFSVAEFTPRLEGNRLELCTRWKRQPLICSQTCPCLTIPGNWGRGAHKHSSPFPALLSQLPCRLPAPRQGTQRAIWCAGICAAP